MLRRFGKKVWGINGVGPEANLSLYFYIICEGTRITTAVGVTANLT